MERLDNWEPAEELRFQCTCLFHTSPGLLGPVILAGLVNLKLAPFSLTSENQKLDWTSVYIYLEPVGIWSDPVKFTFASIWRKHPFVKDHYYHGGESKQIRTSTASWLQGFSVHRMMSGVWVRWVPVVQNRKMSKKHGNNKKNGRDRDKGWRENKWSPENRSIYNKMRKDQSNR